MTTKEINALRKSGRLDEALEAAEREFTINANIYTVGALFWCLNDLYKQQETEEACLTVSRMKSLYADYCKGDELMQKALARAMQRLLPHYQELKEALDQAKAGNNILNKYMSIVGLYENGELGKALYTDFGWITYYALKDISLNDAYTRKKMLRQYLLLDLPRPSLLHSLILKEAIKVEQNTPLQFRIRDFIRLWGLENLTEDDWEQFTTDDRKVIPSLVEKLIGVYAKEVKTDGIIASDDFSELVDKALDRYPKNQNMPYFKAIVLLSQGKKDEAVEHYKKLILKFPSKFYLWSQIAELIDGIDTKIGLLSKALTLSEEESFLGGIRLKMAKLLIAKGLKENARYELNKYSVIYRQNGWNLKQEYRELDSQLSEIVSSVDNSGIYNEFIPNADKFIYSSLPDYTAVKVAETQSDDRNHPDRKITVWIFRTRDTTIRLRKPMKFGLKKRTPDGSLFKVKIHEGKIVRINPSKDVYDENWIKDLSGKAHMRIDRKNKRFSIIDGVYIGEKLLKDISDGETVKIRAILQDDGRWSAVALWK